MLLLAFSALVLAGTPAAPSVSSQMHARYALLTQMRDEVVQGRLEGAKAAARSLADLPDPVGLPAVWPPYVATIESEAGKVVAAAELAAAALATARIAVACSGCHEATSGGPSLARAGAIPAQQWDAGANMQLHAWALDWMWIGLLTNDDAAWARGGTELVKQPLALRFGGAAPAGGQAELEARVYALAARVPTLDAPQERAELYSSLVGTCAACHVLRPASP